jgi:energy-coupling factor transporter ATP-binding protein EcfA2
MKINHIHIENFIGARAVDVPLNSPTTLICGQNGAGKSSVRDAIAFALTADLGRVSLKKDARQLIFDGASSASITLQTSLGEIGVAISSNGRIADSMRGVELPAALPYVLDGQRFAQLDAKERRAFLFGLMGLSAGADEVRKRLTARGCDAKRIKAVIPMLRAGFDAAQSEAAGKARDAKASWREITGETYGEKKAEGWKPALTVDVDEMQLQAAKSALDATNAELAAANQRLGALQERMRRYQQAQVAADGLRKRAAIKPRILEKLKRDRAKLAEWQAKVGQARAAAGVALRNGLIHDLARAVHFLSGHYAGPLHEHEGVLARYEAEYGPVAQPEQHDLEMAAKLPQYEEVLELWKIAVANDERALADAEAAERALAKSGHADPAPDAAEMDAAERHRAQLEVEQVANQSTLDRLKAQRAAAWHADAKSVRAGELHQAVLAWTAIADALGPDGILGEMLAEALGPLNKRLAQSAQVAEWQRVEIAPDMTIRTGPNKRPYALLSESEKWRCDAMIAEAIAHLSGLRLLVLDRFDVLDLQGRSDLVAWLDQLGADGEIESCLLFGTLKAIPANLPETISAHWIENGVVGQLKEAA